MGGFTYSFDKYITTTTTTESMSFPSPPARARGERKSIIYSSSFHIYIYIYIYIYLLTKFIMSFIVHNVLLLILLLWFIFQTNKISLQCIKK